MIPRLTVPWQMMVAFLGLLWVLGGAARPAHAQDPPTEPVVLEPAVVGSAGPSQGGAETPPVAGAAAPAGQAMEGQPRGIMVRLETSSVALGGAATVKLAPAGGGDPIELDLVDDGNSPDVSAGDGIYAGATFVDADAFDVTLTVGDKTFAGGEVSWAADASPARDLVIRLVGDEISVTAAQPASGAGPMSGSTPGAALGPAPGGAAAVGAPVATTSSSAASMSSKDAMLWLAVGLGLVVLAGAGLFASRWVGGGAPDAPDPVGEPGLFGDGTPSLSESPAWWVVEGDGLRDALLQSVASQHRILLVAPTGVAVPRVLGGPAYRADWDADSAEDAAYAVTEQPGRRLVAVLWSPDAEPASVQPILEALPDDVGAMVVSASVPDGAGATVVRLRETDSGAVLDTTGGAVVLKRIGTALEALGRA